MYAYPHFEPMVMLHAVDAAGRQRSREEIRKFLALASGPEVRRSVEDVDERGQGAGGSGLAEALRLLAVERSFQRDLVARLGQHALVGDKLAELAAHRLCLLDSLSTFDVGGSKRPAPDHIEAAGLINVSGSFAMHDSLQRIVSDVAPYLLEEFTDRDLVAAQLQDALVSSEYLDGGPDGGHEEVGPSNALRPEVVEALVQAGLQLGLDIVDKAIARFPPLVAGDEDGGGKSRAVVGS